MKYLFIFSVLSFLNGCAMQAPMVVSPTADGKYWVLKEPLIYQHPETEQQVVIPKGFVTDLASVPRAFWIALPPCEKYTPATVLHDYLYWVQDSSCDRECADKTLLLAMKEAGVGWTTRNSIYTGVRLGGESAWNKNAERKKAGEVRIIPEQFLNFSSNESWADIRLKIITDTID